MKKTKYLIRQSVLIAFSVLIGCSPEEKPLVEVGDLKISKDEFLLTYQYNPHLASIKNRTVAKNLLLETLIIQKLIIQRADNKLRQSDQLQQAADQFEREAIIEEFWQKEILDSIEISDAELYDHYLNSKKKRIIKFVPFISKEDAEQAAQKLKKGLLFEQMAYEAGIPSGYIPRDTITADHPDQFLAEQIFKLPKGEVSDIIEIRSNYYLISVDKDLPDIGISGQEFNAKKHKLRKKLRLVKAKNKFNAKVRAAQNRHFYTLDRAAFKKITTVLKNNLQSSNSSIIDVTSDEKYESLQNLPLVRFSDKNIWTSDDLLQRIRLAPYPLDYSDPDKLQYSLIKAAKNVLDDEVLVNIARGSKKIDSKKVKEDVRIWTEFSIYKRQLAKYLNDNESGQQNRRALIRAITDTKISLNRAAYDSIQVDKFDMIVYKQHFPERTIAPIIQPFPFNQVTHKIDSLLAL